MRRKLPRESEIDRADWHKHMDYVQAIIARLANNSFVMKGWALTLTSALLGFAATRGDALLAFLALVAVLAFWFLDAYFLRQERAFRLMFADVASKNVAGFNLNPARYAEQVKWWPVLRSVSLGVFYGALLMLSLVLATILLTAVTPTLPSSRTEPSPAVSVSP